MMNLTYLPGAGRKKPRDKRSTLDLFHYKFQGSLSVDIKVNRREALEIKQILLKNSEIGLKKLPWTSTSMNMTTTNHITGLSIINKLKYKY